MNSTYKITAISFYHNKQSTTAYITAFNEESQKQRLKAFAVTTAESIKLVKAIGSSIDLVDMGPCKQTPYEIQNGIPAATQVAVSPPTCVKRKLVFDEPLAKEIKTERKRKWPGSNHRWYGCSIGLANHHQCQSATEIGPGFRAIWFRFRWRCHQRGR